jgi:hypothetical protein
MKLINLLISASASLFITSCGDNSAPPTSSIDPWTSVKDSTAPTIVLTSEFGTPYKQSLSTMGWEDGIHMSRDGLDLYCIYIPGDVLSWTLNSSNPTAFTPYQRGPLLGMDLITSPVGASSWAHGDIMYAHRNSLTDNFITWTQTGISRTVYSEGAPYPFEKSSSSFGMFLFTSNEKPVAYYPSFNPATDTFDTDIWCINSTTLNPSASDTRQPLSGFPRTTYTEDNPCAERYDANTIIMMFDSENYNGITSNGLDVWYSISTNNGASWSIPANVSSINTALQENQPHLYKNASNEWFLYYSATNTADGKLAIYRAKQKTANNWNNWDTPQLVISAGNTAGIGEPTLTSNGDISFVVVYDKGSSNTYDRYDADPWFVPKKP